MADQTAERYYDCRGVEILPRCRDGEIMMRNGDNVPQCVYMQPTPCGATLFSGMLLLALMFGIFAGRRLFK